LRQMIQRAVVDPCHVHGVQDLEEPVQDGDQPGDDLREPVQLSATAQVYRVVSNHLDPQDALAFGIDLEGQPSAMDFEDRQIILRSLDHDLESNRFLLVVAPATLLDTKDRFDGADVQGRSRSVDQPLEDLVHNAAVGEHQVAAILGLIDRVSIAKTGPLLFVQIQGKAQARTVDPTLADLFQAPYRVVRTQGVCDLSQACGVGGLGEAVPLLGEADLLLAGSSRHIFVAVQHDLGGEGRMAAELDGQPAPLRIKNMKGIMIHVRLRLLAADVDSPLAEAPNVPDRKGGTADDNAEDPELVAIGGQVLLGDVVLSFATVAVDHWYVILVGPGAKASTEAPRHAHEMRIIEILVRAIEQPPPRAKPTRRLSEEKVSVQDDTINAVVSPFEPRRVMLAKGVRVKQRGFCPTPSLVLRTGSGFVPRRRKNH